MTRAIIRFVGVLAIAAGAGCLSYVATVLLQAREHSRSFHPEAAAPLVLVEGAAIGEVRVDRLGIRAVVSQGSTDNILDLGPGHLTDTPWIGQPGNVVIAGHRDTTFRPLRNVRVGDVIDVTTHDKNARYSVVSTQIVLPTDLSVLQPGDANSLTLITCYPFWFIGHAPKRFIVRAVEMR